MDSFTFAAAPWYGMFTTTDRNICATFDHDGEMMILDFRRDKRTVIDLKPETPLQPGHLYGLAESEFKKYLAVDHNGQATDD